MYKFRYLKSPKPIANQVPPADPIEVTVASWPALVQEKPPLISARSSRSIILQILPPIDARKLLGHKTRAMTERYTGERKTDKVRALR